MNVIMNIIVAVIMVFFFNSCNQVNKSEASLVENQDNVFLLDSLLIKYWKSTEANEYYYIYSDSTIIINSQYFAVNKKLSEKIVINSFLNYINVLFINNTQNIIVRKTKTKETIITNYSVIKLKGYKNGDIIINQNIQIGEEGFDIEYSPIFLEFYDFLDNLLIDTI